MDILSRFVSGGSSSPTRHSSSSQPQQRLIRFKRSHDQLQSIWRKVNTSKKLVGPENVLACLEEIHKILQDEGQTPAPHLCARHVFTFQIYTNLAQVACSYYNEPIIVETLDIFKLLIESEEMEFLEVSGFADALLGLMGQFTTAGVEVETQARIVEILFGIAAKLRMQPELLPTWFKSTAQDTTQNAKADQGAFPLFYFMLNYVHHEGRAGDFARTGLLYLIESATHSEALEKWIVESDLASLMASGLGALYSQLGRKLVLSFPKDSVPAIVSFSEAPRPQTPSDAEKTTSPEFQSHLSTFLSYLVFWQDLLEHCNSDDVKQGLIDHFKFLFLQQLLYPSLIESSDVDGGSSVAVLTYLRCIIESIDHADLLNVTLEYLLALPEKHDKIEESKIPRPTTLARRRKSQDLISNLALGQEKPMPDLFTLVDLVLTSLASRDQQTVAATLRLVSVLLRSQHRYGVSSIVKTQHLNETSPARTITAHNRDIEILFSMVEDLMENEDLADAYEAHLQDARTLLESHCCSMQMLALPSSDILNQEKSTRIQSHIITTDDPLVKALVSLLEDFLANDIATNLGLTQVVSALASCGHTRLEPWLLSSPDGQVNGSDDDLPSSDDPADSDLEKTVTLNAGNPDLDRMRLAGAVTDVTARRNPIPNVSTSPVFAALDNLIGQIEKFRCEIQEFDIYLAERRHVFKVGEDIDKAVANDLSPPRRSAETGRPSASQTRGALRMGSISERIMSETSSATGSRASSPRGRQLGDPSTPAFVGRLNHLRISPSPSPSKPGSRGLSPSLLQQGSIASTPPRRVATPMGPGDALRQKIKIKGAAIEGAEVRDIGSDTSSLQSESVISEVKPVDEVREVNLSHLLTNVIILQEFVLELAAIVEVRASMFGEVMFV